MHKSTTAETWRVPSKLTLKLDAGAIRQAKIYAKKRHTSLSQLVEAYFRMVGREAVVRSRFTPLVRELSGIIPHEHTVNLGKKYVDHLDQKYR